MININSRSSKPIYEQIIDEIKEKILIGVLQPGDKLPSVRELSSIITANPNTVSKAYMELERQKIIETLRGKGTYISSDYKPRKEEGRVKKLKEDIKKIILEAHYMGIEKEELIEIMKSFYEDTEKQIPRNGEKNEIT